jgi:metal-responsive CopG/Arc/MetJ family transcriptional regulator
MKTAVSIPNSLLEGAERLLKRTGKFRSQLYSDAVKEYLARHAPDAVTEAMDRACAEAGGGADPYISAASSRILA